MSTVTHAGLWVHDLDEALSFYTQKLGWEVREDVTLPEMGGYRWLTVGPAGEPIAFILNVPGPPVMDEATAKQVLDLIGRGLVSGFHLATDDCHAAYEDLAARGVEFTELPEDRPYGVDAQFRDPSGHAFRLVQRKAVPATA
jgi:catechol 2,3-dioxygenase-like lactoylglutathione lyase family enzyme